MISGAIKRMTDIIVATLALIILSPVLLIGCLVVLVTMGWPVIFMHERSGKERCAVPHGQTSNNADRPERQDDRQRAHHALVFYLRKFSIDELPQLLNVLPDQ